MKTHQTIFGYYCIPFCCLALKSLISDPNKCYSQFRMAWTARITKTSNRMPKTDQIFKKIKNNSQTQGPFTNSLSRIDIILSTTFQHSYEDGWMRTKNSVTWPQKFISNRFYNKLLPQFFHIIIQASRGLQETFKNKSCIQGFFNHVFGDNLYFSW